MYILIIFKLNRAKFYLTYKEAESFIISERIFVLKANSEGKKSPEKKFVSLFMLASKSIFTKLEELRNNLDPDDQLEPIGRLDPALMEDHINSNIGTHVQPILPSDSRQKTYIHKHGLFVSVLWIRDILVRMRMRILGSVPLSNGSGFRSGRLKNIRILRIRMRIRNTGKKS